MLKNKEFIKLVLEIFNSDSLKIKLNKNIENYNISIIGPFGTEINLFNYDESKYSDESVVKWYAEFKGKTNFILYLDDISKLSIIKTDMLPLLIELNEYENKIINLYTKLKLDDKELLRKGNINLLTL
jgi:hypothetical protein